MPSVTYRQQWIIAGHTHTINALTAISSWTWLPSFGLCYGLYVCAYVRLECRCIVAKCLNELSWFVVRELHIHPQKGRPVPQVQCLTSKNFWHCHHSDTHSWNSSAGRSMDMPRLVDGSRSALPACWALLLYCQVPSASVSHKGCIIFLAWTQTVRHQLLVDLSPPSFLSKTHILYLSFHCSTLQHCNSHTRIGHHSL